MSKGIAIGTEAAGSLIAKVSSGRTVHDVHVVVNGV